MTRYKEVPETDEELYKILDKIKVGDRVTIENRFGQRQTGRAVMKGAYGWVLNMGGRHGTPAIVDEQNTVKVVRR